MITQERFEHQLRRSAAALTIDVDPARAHRRARERTRTRRLAVGVLSLLVLAAGAIGVRATSPETTGLHIADDGEDGLGLTWTASDLVTTTEHWRELRTTVVGDDGWLYQLVTTISGAGTADPTAVVAQVIERSVDGLRWALPARA